MRNNLVKQTGGFTAEAVPVQYPVPAEIFQMLDPPFVSTSPKKTVHRDCEIFKVSMTVTAPGTTDTTFRILMTDLDVPEFDLLAGGGLLPAGEEYVEWWLNPRPFVRRMSSRIWVDITAVGAGATGLIFEVLFL